MSPPLYTASFHFRPGRYDAEFHRLNDLIETAARATEGFLGSESWLAADGENRCVVYYWSSLEALAAFSRNGHHREAKRQYARWYDGYQIVIARVERAYGDGRLPHPSSVLSPAPGNIDADD